MENAGVVDSLKRIEDRVRGETVSTFHLLIDSPSCDFTLKPIHLLHLSLSPAGFLQPPSLLHIGRDFAPLIGLGT